MNDGEVDPDFEALLAYVRDSRGFDFTGYKRTSLLRRVGKRMESVGVDGYGVYLDYLQVHPEEFRSLFDNILINVTGFFRDPQVWDYLTQDIAPRIIEARGGEHPIRLWSAGCASGEEAYSVAIVLAEAMGEAAFRERVKIYATDIDEEALTQARAATYSAKQVEPIPPHLLRLYFERSGSGFTFRRDLRRTVIFGRHDLVQDAPISHIDLLACRNTLMYLNAETQSKVIGHLHHALNDGGYLLLGKAELLFTHVGSFTPVDIRRRVFVKADGGDVRERLLLMTHMGDRESGQLSNHVRTREAAFDAAPVAQIVVDRRGRLALANQLARRMFGLNQEDLGRPFRDLELSYRPAELRSSLDRVIPDRAPEKLSGIAWVTPSGEAHDLDIELVPLVEAGGMLTGVSITFGDVTANAALRRELEHSTQELETAMEELQSTNEELETTNEELQSTNEELETTNEELQSTNEELETMNEELQSTNEELQTINDELRDRTTELDQVNVFMESILTSIQAAVVVLDRELKVRAWNRQAEDLWGVRTEEATGQSFFDLDFGFPAERVKAMVERSREVRGSREELTVEARNRRGQSFQCRATVASLAGGEDEASGVIVLMENVSGSQRP
jgi:two-component system CheB/CheR fusion protein